MERVISNLQSCGLGREVVSQLPFTGRQGDLEVWGQFIGERVDDSDGAVVGGANDCLPADRIGVGPVAGSVEGGAGVRLEQGGDFCMQGESAPDQGHLCVGEPVDVAGEAQAPEEGGGEGVVHPDVAVIRVEDSPNERLTRRHDALDISRDDGDRSGFVCVREGTHRSKCHHGRFEPVAAGRAVLNDEIGKGGAEMAEESLHPFQVLAQTFAE